MDLTQRLYVRWLLGSAMGPSMVIIPIHGCSRRREVSSREEVLPRSDTAVATNDPLEASQADPAIQNLQNHILSDRSKQKYVETT